MLNEDKFLSFESSIQMPCDFSLGLQGVDFTDANPGISVQVSGP